jgi:hypothetical protein
VYLVPLSPGVGARTVAEDDADPDDAKHASPAFIEIDPSLPEDDVVAFAEHELHHALQFAQDLKETVGFLEMTAVLQEIRADPENDAWQEALAAFQALPQAPLFADGFAIDDAFPIEDLRYEYGAVLLALYLDEVLGDDVIRQVLEASVEPDDVDENEPDWLDALEETTGTTPAELALGFVGWRALVGSLEVDGDGPAETIPATARLGVGAVSLDSLRGDDVTTVSPQGPYQLGCVVRAFTAPTAAPLPMHVEVESPEARTLGIAVLTAVENGGEAERTVVDETGPSLALDFEVPAGQLAHVAFCDLGDGTDADDELVLQPITFRLLRTDVEFPGEGEGEEGEGEGEGEGPPDTCGCGAAVNDARAPNAPASLGFALLLLVPLGRRAQRARRPTY